MNSIHELMRDRIMKGKPLTRKNAHTKIEIIGDFYNVWFYRTKIAIGKVGDMPFAFNIDGWNTSTTIMRLRALGFYLWSKRIVVGEFIKPTTHRKNKIYQSVLHINDTPMVTEITRNGKDWKMDTDYHSWYTKEGRKININV